MNDTDILKTYFVMKEIETAMLLLDNKTQLVAALGTAIDVWCKEKGEKSIAVAYLLNTKVVEVNTKFGEFVRENENYYS